MNKMQSKTNKSENNLETLQKVEECYVNGDIRVQSFASKKQNPVYTNVLNGENKLSGEAMARRKVIFNKLKSTWITRGIFFIGLYTCIASIRMLNHSYPTYAIIDKNVSAGLKYVLLWTNPDYYPFYELLHGQESFIKKNCSVTNCYVTDNKNIFGGDLSRFDAIAFNGRHLRANNLPMTRYPHQKYIFFQTESADNYPVCNEKFDGFFNWTATYKLDSDIPFPYFYVKDNNGNIVGPKINMHWTHTTSKADIEKLEFYSKLKKKSKAAAWFISNCNGRSKRTKYVTLLQKELKKYGLVIDIFGKCGNKKCPREEQYYCNELLEKDYYFYMAMENSFADDYATEKILIAVENFAIPIVYGGANYSRFLPPTSYVPATSIGILAKIMNYLIENPDLYYEYFRWRSYYSFHDSNRVNICAVCQTLNDADKFETVSVHENFRYWWHPTYKERCAEFWWLNGQ